MPGFVDYRNLFAKLFQASTWITYLSLLFLAFQKFNLHQLRYSTRGCSKHAWPTLETSLRKILTIF